MRRYVIVLALLLPILAVAQPVERTDTIGGTTYDWFANGPSYRMIANDTAYGVHALWMFSADPGPSWPDRNMRYNFFDKTQGAWNWLDPSNFMNSGLNVFTVRSGYGSMDVSATTGCAYVSAHHGAIFPSVSRDAAPGAGIFENCSGESNANMYQWPPISLGMDDRVHVSLIDNASQNGLYYTQVNPWCTWASPISGSNPGPEPNFPDQYIEASKVSNKVMFTWVETNDAGTLPYPMYYRLSTDGGVNWDDPVQLPYPPAFTLPDTTPSFHYAGSSVLWDNNDEWHILATIMPIVHDTGWVIPAEVWHYFPNNNPPWSFVARATAESLLASVGYNAIYLARPVLGIDAGGGLYCVWEQFNSENPEPVTAKLRADVYANGSHDNGATWNAPRKLTVSDGTTRRFPSLARCVDDYLHILMLNDQVAGFLVQSEGPSTDNPVVYIKVPAESILPAGVAEQPSRRILTTRMAVAPNPFGVSTGISYELPRAGPAKLAIYDASGNLVKSLVSGNLPAGRGTATWNGTNELGNMVAGGIYFARLSTADRVLNQKLVFTH